MAKPGGPGKILADRAWSIRPAREGWPSANEQLKEK